MNFVKKNRLKANITVSEMANKLNIPYIKYKPIDEGFVKMPTNLIDKFNEITHNVNGENTIEKINEEEIVNKWWDEMCQKQAHGKYKINEKMEEFNIPTLKRLSELLGYKSTGALSGYLSGKHPIGFEVKHRIYHFFKNELNIQDPRTNLKKPGQGVGGGRKACDDVDLKEWYKNFDMLNWLKTHGDMTQPEFAKKIGMSKSTFYYFVKQRKLGKVPTKETISIVKNAIENWDGSVVTIKEDQEPMVVDLINNKDENAVDPVLVKYTEEIVHIEEIISDLERQRKVLDNTIAEVIKKKEIYQEFVNDLKQFR